MCFLHCSDFASKTRRVVSTLLRSSTPLACDTDRSLCTRQRCRGPAQPRSGHALSCHHDSLPRRRSPNATPTKVKAIPRSSQYPDTYRPRSFALLTKVPWKTYSLRILHLPTQIQPRVRRVVDIAGCTSKWQRNESFA